MVKDFVGEKWAGVKLNFIYTNDYALQVSNFGRLKSFNKVSAGNILNGTTINGYRIIRLKFFRPRQARFETEIARLQEQFNNLAKEVRVLKKENDNKHIPAQKEDLLKATRKQLNKVLKEDRKLRTINYHSLIHRLVAEYFLPKPQPGEIKVAHLDYNKLNNRFDNLKWMAPEENFKHQQKSPHVIKEKDIRKSGIRENHKVAKLTVTKVMLLKKMLHQNKPMKQLKKQFKITDTQILRIKRGENWKNIPAAE